MSKIKTQAKRDLAMLDLPRAITGKRLLIRGTRAWDERERARQLLGCSCLSFGTLDNSVLSRGKTSRHMPERRKT